MCDNKIELVDYNDKKKREKQLFYANNAEFDNDDSTSESEKSVTEDTPREEQRKVPEARLQRVWENGGPVKLLRLPGDEAFILTLKNYKNMHHDKLRNMLSKHCEFLSMRELGDNCVRVRFKSEEELRKCYVGLRGDKRFAVTVLLDMEDFITSRKKTNLVKRLSKLMCKNIYNPVDETNCITENSEIYEKALDIEGGIKFDLKPLPLIKENSRKKNRSAVEYSRQSYVGMWNDQTVIEPSTPFINKYLKPPPSYLRWKGFVSKARSRNESLSENDKMEQFNSHTCNMLKTFGFGDALSTKFCDETYLSTSEKSFKENDAIKTPTNKPLYTSDRYHTNTIYNGSLRSSSSENDSCHNGCMNKSDVLDRILQNVSAKHVLSSTQSDTDYQEKFSYNYATSLTSECSGVSSNKQMDRSNVSLQCGGNFEPMPPLISIFDLYALWLRKSVFEML